MPMAFAASAVRPQPSKEDLMRLAALRAGALPPRGAEDSPPVDVLPNGAALMRSGDVFGNNGLSQSAAAAKQVLDSAMAQSGDNPPQQAPMPTFNPPVNPRAGMAFRGQRPAFNPNQRYGDGFDPVTGTMSLSGGAAMTSPPGDGAGPGAVDDNITAADVRGRIHPKFFQHGGIGEKILHGLGEFALEYSASNGNPAAMMTLQQRAADRNSQRQFGVWQQQEALRRQQELDDRDYEANKPRYFAGNEDYRRYDPSTNQVDTLFDAPRPEQEYAGQFGQPGSPEYQTALKDYVLKGYGSTAMAARTDLNDQRFKQRLQLKQTPTYGNLHPRPSVGHAPHQPTTSNVVAGILQKGANGQPLNPQEQQIFGSYVNGRRGGRGTGAGSSVSEGTIIKNPQTGQRMKMQGGSWVAI